MTTSMFQTHYFEVEPQRRLALSVVGDSSASRILLCLPGLLETRETFDPLLTQAAALSDVQVVALDHCGRGDSDGLLGDVGYTMSRYLDDIVQLIQRHAWFEHAPSLYLVGTSMGGILSLYLAERLGSKVKGVMLNDVGVSLHWVSLYSLYGGMKKSGALKDLNALAQKLNVREAVIAAVQLPTHFDLTYQRDWRGMHFDKVLRGFQGDVRLVRGKDSTVCLVAQVRELQRLWPQAQVLEVAQAAHPVAFTPQVCAFFLTPFESTSTAPVQTWELPAHAPEPASALTHWWRRLRSGFRR